MSSRNRATRKRIPLVGIMGWVIAGIPILLAAAVIWGAAGAALGAYLCFSYDLPKIPDLKAYRPKTVSTFYAEDGTVIGIFYKEKRFPIPLASLPKHVTQAFLAAEDARFFSHPGVDYFGVVRAVVKNLKAGNFAQGGSTITQQVTRNLILSKEKRLSRKIREAILSFRIEKTLTKEEILELYLNEIYLGKGSYGVEAAARAYFGKNAADLTVAEAAMIAGFVSNPSKYGTPRGQEAAMKRREFVLDNMLRYGFISEDQFRDASDEAPRFRENLPNPFERVPYFTEAARRYIIQRYGEKRLYNEGLEVWTTCSVSLQEKASEALLAGVKAWEKRQGRPSGMLRRLNGAEVKEFLKPRKEMPHHPGDVVRAMVLGNHSMRKDRKGKKSVGSVQECTLALPGGMQVRMNLESPVEYRPNQLLEMRVKETGPDGPILEQQTLPPLQGAVVSIENRTGYVRALVGGLDFERSSFNRAVQGFRQPGSSFKPLFYAAALEWGNYSPHTLILDEPIAVSLDSRRPEWVPGNADGHFLGLMTLQDALAHSRNIVAVKLLMDMGVKPGVRMARSMGIHSHLDENLSLALGTSEVTPLELTSAYTVFPNMGVRMVPVLVKMVKDRFGNVLEDNTVTPLDVAAEVARASRPPGDDEVRTDGPDEHVIDDEATYQGPYEPTALLQQSDRGRAIIPEPRMREPDSPANAPTVEPSEGRRVLSPETAYLMVSMLRRACVSGTAAATNRLKRKDLAGKTGTTDDSSDAWFVGFNPTYTTGVWIGYDAKVSLGRGEHGATAALPVWMSFMKEALAGEPSTRYPVPAGIGFHRQVQRSHDDPLTAEPDFFATAGIKPVCPIDFEFILASAPTQPFLNQMMTAGYSANEAGPAIRILSKSGQDQGFGHFVPDSKGNPVLRRDWPLQTPDAVAGFEAVQQRPGPIPSMPPHLSEMGQRLLGFSRAYGWHR